MRAEQAPAQLSGDAVGDRLGVGGHRGLGIADHGRRGRWHVLTRQGQPTVSAAVRFSSSARWLARQK
jgi:hypothetical protein